MRKQLFALALATIFISSAVGADKPEFAPLPKAVCSFGAAASDGWAYVYGGHCGKAHTYSTEDVVGTFHRIKLTGGKKWEALPGGPSLQGLCLVAHKGRLYRIGGMQPHNKVGEPADNHSTAVCKRFNPGTKKWESLPDMPEGRSSHDAVIVDDKLYVIGGWHMQGAGKQSNWHKKVFVLDLNNGKAKWETIEQPFRRRALSAAVSGGKIYVIGGLLAERGMSKSVDIFDPKTGKWSKGPDLPKSRMSGFSPAVAVAGDQIYVSVANGDVLRLTGGKIWEPISKLKHTRLVHRVLPLNEESLVVIGGSTRGGNVEEIETVSLTGEVPEEPNKEKDTSNDSAWSGFRGDGSSRTRATGLPAKWTPKDVAWKTTLPGYGQSSPVVFGNRAFVTCVEGPNKEKCLIASYDVKTGKELWKKSVEATQTVKTSAMVSRAAPTPCVDANGLYVFFESGELLKLSLEGKIEWQRSLVKEYGKFQSGHGIGSSLTQTPNAVVVLIDHEGPSYLLAVDKKTGKNLWKTDRKSRISWASPVIASRGGKLEVIVSSNGSVDSYDAETGKQLWSFADVSGNTVASATVSGEFVVLGASPSRRAPEAGTASKSNCCLRLVMKEGKRSYAVAWRAENATSSFASPLIHGGCAYFINKVGALYCLDLKTGKENYVQRVGGSCWATPLGAGDHVYFFGKDGKTTVIEAGAKFKVVAKNEQWSAEDVKTAVAPEQQKRDRESRYGRSIDPVVYGVAVSDSAFLVRSGKELARIGK